MATVRDRGRCRERLEQLSESSLDCESLQREARGACPVASLSAETGGDLARSRRWDEVLRPVGIGDEAVVACRDALGCRGWIKAYRDDSDASFADDDLELLAQVGPAHGSALRRRLGGASRGTVAAPTSPGVVLLDEDLRAVGWTAGAREWIDALPLAGVWAAWGILPAVVYPVAALARARNGASDAHALERATDGRWVKIEVVAALLAGLDTRAVGARLCISPHTVQDHLKSVFAKTGAHSRRELLARFSGASDPTSRHG